jgi:hypothetical protein
MARRGSYPQGTINSCAKHRIMSSYKPLSSTFLGGVSTPQVTKLMSTIRIAAYCAGVPLGHAVRDYPCE